MGVGKVWRNCAYQRVGQLLTEQLDVGVRLHVSPPTLVHDEEGRFVLEVNGEPVFCRGANWIPARLFPHGQTLEDVTPLLAAACEAWPASVRVAYCALWRPAIIY